MVGRNEIAKPWYTKSSMPSEIKDALKPKVLKDQNKKSKSKDEGLSKAEKKIKKK